MIFTSLRNIFADWSVRAGACTLRDYEVDIAVTVEVSILKTGELVGANVGQCVDRHGETARIQWEPTYSVTVVLFSIVAVQVKLDVVLSASGGCILCITSALQCVQIHITTS